MDLASLREFRKEPESPVTFPHSGNVIARLYTTLIASHPIPWNTTTVSPGYPNEASFLLDACAISEIKVRESLLLVPSRLIIGRRKNRSSHRLLGARGVRIPNYPRGPCRHPRVKLLSDRHSADILGHGSPRVA